MNPPVAKKVPYTHSEHGVERSDPYYWMRRRDDPAVIEHIEAENSYLDHTIEPLAPLRKVLYDEMLARIQETDQTAAIPRGPWAYYTRTEEGRAYTLHCRKPREGGEETIVVDENLLADGHDFFNLQHLAISPDHQRVAYTVDTKGDEIFTLVVRDLTSGEVIDKLSLIHI